MQYPYHYSLYLPTHLQLELCLQWGVFPHNWISPSCIWGWPSSGTDRTVLTDGTKPEDYSLQWFVVSQITKPDLFCLFWNKGLKVKDKQCGLSVWQCVTKSYWKYVCVDVCVFPHLLSEFDLCTVRAEGCNNLVLGFDGTQCFHWREGDRKRDRQTDWETDSERRRRQRVLQLLSG